MTAPIGTHDGRRRFVQQQATRSKRELRTTERETPVAFERRARTVHMQKRHTVTDIIACAGVMRCVHRGGKCEGKVASRPDEWVA